jgi:hypothetical protein
LPKRVPRTRDDKTVTSATRRKIMSVVIVTKDPGFGVHHPRGRAQGSIRRVARLRTVAQRAVSVMRSQGLGPERVKREVGCAADGCARRTGVVSVAAALP